MTGTPLLKSERESWRVFGNYLHTYYYDKSVQDGYTLKIIREDIETSYKEKLEEIYHSLENLVQKKDVKKDDIIEHPNYVKELLRYIITDLKRFRIIRGDDTLGGMVICETSEQARRLFAYFDEIQNELNKDASSKSHFKVGLILYDSDDKDTRENVITDFKDNFKVDMLIVYNMLLARLWKYITIRTTEPRKYYRYINGEKIEKEIHPVLGGHPNNNPNLIYTMDFHVTPHMLRHTYITDLIYAGVDPKTVQYLAGHENSKTTMDIYCKLKYNKPEDLRPIVNGAFAGGQNA